MDLYRAAVFFLMIPSFADRSIIEKVEGSREVAEELSFAVSARRIARIV